MNSPSILCPYRFFFGYNFVSIILNYNCLRLFVVDNQGWYLDFFLWNDLKALTLLSVLLNVEFIDFFNKLSQFQLVNRCYHVEIQQ